MAMKGRVCLLHVIPLCFLNTSGKVRQPLAGGYVSTEYIDATESCNNPLNDSILQTRRIKNNLNNRRY